MFRCANTIVVKVIKSGRRKVKNTWTENKGCHMSHETVIKCKAALQLSFPELYSV